MHYRVFFARASILDTQTLKIKFDDLYKHYHRRRFVHPDPLEFLYSYRDVRDREIVGLIASSLAYGRVAQILKSVSRVLEVIGYSPCDFLQNATMNSLERAFAGFSHRFANGDQLAALLFGVKKAISRFGSLNICFLAGMSPHDENIIPAMTFFSDQLGGKNGGPGHLLARPEKGSACKRLNLFLRWMVRKDEVDPGGWNGISCSKLIIPLDTHMYRIGMGLRLTERRGANMHAALEITSAFKRIAPDDPVKYDFALTRLGIRDDVVPDNFKGLCVGSTSTSLKR